MALVHITMGCELFSSQIRTGVFHVWDPYQQNVTVPWDWASDLDKEMASDFWSKKESRSCLMIRCTSLVTASEHWTAPSPLAHLPPHRTYLKRWKHGIDIHSSSCKVYD